VPLGGATAARVERPRLAVFDVDGTLTDTAGVDSQCFAQALVEEFGFRDLDTRWASYDEFTDSSIVREVFEAHRGGAPTPEEISRLIDRFVGTLERAHDADPSRFAPIEGAPALVSGLASHDGWRVAVATGGWERSARLKLAYAGIDVGDAPMASADVSEFRAEIVRWAIDRAAERLGGGGFAGVVLVGDTHWDVRMARELGHGFVGVGSGESARKLTFEGAGSVVEGFGDYDATVQVLETAGPPSPARGEGPS
jgi:phosphoglycolate phosphatase-like HAD superfamily hydrolase